MDPRLQRAKELLAGSADPVERRPFELSALASRREAAGDRAGASGALGECAGWFGRHPLRGESDPESILDGGVTLLLAGLRDRGRSTLEAALETGRLPPDSAAGLVRALARLETGDAEGAFRALEAILPAFSDEPCVNLALAALDLSRGAFASARVYAARARSAEGFAHPAALLLALAFAREGRFDEALEACAGADPLDRETAHLSAWLLFRLDRIDEARDRLDAHPDRDARMEGALGYLEFLRGDLPGATARLRAAGPGEGALHRRLLGDLAALAGRRDEAIGHYGERLRARPDDRVTRANLAHVCLLEGRIDEAEQALEPLFRPGAPPPDERAHALRYKVETLRKLREHRST